MVNRLAGETGFCGAGVNVKVARAAPHFWEEPCLSGGNGSGTVFFSYCTMRCVYCQNALYGGGKGTEVTPERLGQIFVSLQEQKAHNINLVTPTHYIPQIIGAIRRARNDGLSIPIVYNSGGYDTAESISLLDGYIDIYLPDFKYCDGCYAKKYSGVSDYFKYASESIGQMVKQAGPAVFDADGIMQKGVIIRHLVLPGLTEDSKKVIGYLYGAFGDDVYISIMNQYTPLERVRKYPELNRTVGEAEYDLIVDYAISIGVGNGFIQEGGAAGESFIPDF